MRDCFKEVKKDLDAGKHVLFSGTSCQVAGLYLFLQKEYTNLLCTDIVCHGVPSKKVWHEYLDWISKGKEIVNVNFRNKVDFGWTGHIETITVGTKNINSEVFKNIFYGHNAIRPSCYECPFKSIHHPGDITIADYWGIDNAAPGFSDNKGVSLVLLNTEKGQFFFENAKENVIWQETRIENSMQSPFEGPYKSPITRDYFWSDFAKNDFAYIAKKYGDYTFKYRLKQIIKRIISKKSTNL